MLNYQRFAIAIVVVFCSLAVFAVTATNNADTILFAEIPWTLSSPPPVQSYQDINGQSSELLILGIVEPTLFIDLYTGAPEPPSVEPYLRTFSLDQNGILVAVDLNEIFMQNKIACGNCGPVLNPLGTEELIKQEDYIYKGNDTIACGNCAGIKPITEFLL